MGLKQNRFPKRSTFIGFLSIKRNFGAVLMREWNELVLSTELIGKRPFLSCFEPHHKSELSCIVFIMKISLHSYANKTMQQASEEAEDQNGHQAIIPYLLI